MVIWTEPAKKDLKNIYVFISKDSIFYAKKVRDEIVDKSKMLNLYPKIGRVVPEINNSKIREVFLYSYRLIYKIEESNVFILTIIHGKKNFEGLN